VEIFNGFTSNGSSGRVRRTFNYPGDKKAEGYGEPLLNYRLTTKHHWKLKRETVKVIVFSVQFGGAENKHHFLFR